MQFDPNTVKDASWLVPEGEYDFEIVHAEDSVSKFGVEQMFFKFRVFLADGETALIHQYIGGKHLYKLKHLCNSIGCIQFWNDGDCDPGDMLNKSGRGFLGTYDKNDGTKRNTFQRFLKPKEDSKKKLEDDIKNVEGEDDIPF
tara:strand:+ start:7379 stop:7807 length:429 start_codon:yes stop_codon:yes gene_type:complete